MPASEEARSPQESSFLLGFALRSRASGAVALERLNNVPD